MTKIKTMQELSVTFPEIYRDKKLLCHAQKNAGGVTITVIDKYNVSFQVRGGSPGEAYANLMHKLGEK